MSTDCPSCQVHDEDGTVIEDDGFVLDDEWVAKHRDDCCGACREAFAPVA